MTGAYLYAAARTPFGRFGGALAGVRPDDLAATAVSGVLAKVPHLDPETIGEVDSETPTAPARRTATSAGWLCCWRDCRRACRPRR